VWFRDKLGLVFVLVLCYRRWFTAYNRIGVECPVLAKIDMRNFLDGIVRGRMSRGREYILFSGISGEFKIYLRRNVLHSCLTCVIGLFGLL